MSNEALDKVTILYEDDSCAVVNKPAGLLVHADGRSAGPFLTDWIAEKFPQAMNVGEPAHDLKGNDIARPGIVHRLDRETSGALIIAKTSESFRHLKAQFQDHGVSKKYLAFVWGELTEEFGTISRPIGRSGSDFRKWSAQRGARGDLREAETYWTKVKSKKLKVKSETHEAQASLEEEYFTFVELQPKTGRTHQIRVHMNAINHPVVGDTLYAPKRPMALGFERLALHSWCVEFETDAGNKVKVTAPLPADFQAALRLMDVPEGRFS
jgi:23S rRNA pseudouridine1911/1915/1917 synthase